MVVTFKFQKKHQRTEVSLNLDVVPAVGEVVRLKIAGLWYEGKVYKRTFVFDEVEKAEEETEVIVSLVGVV